MDNLIQQRATLVKLKGCSEGSDAVGDLAAVAIEKEIAAITAKRDLFLKKETSAKKELDATKTRVGDDQTRADAKAKGEDVRGRSRSPGAVRADASKVATLTTKVSDIKDSIKSLNMKLEVLAGAAKAFTTGIAEVKDILDMDL